MSRRSSGFVGAWAEMQRQQQRQREAEARQRREHARQADAYQRHVAQSHKEFRHAEARWRTEELEAQVVALQGLLAAYCRAPAFRAASLMRSADVRPFAPGPLAAPLPMPDPNQYRAQGGWTANRRAQAEAEARARFERDWQAAQAAEAQRQHQLAAYQREYTRWAETQLAEIRRHNTGITEVTEGVRGRDPESVVEYFTAALYSSGAWPEGFPGRSWPPTTRRHGNWSSTGSCRRTTSSPRPSRCGTCRPSTRTRRRPVRWVNGGRCTGRSSRSACCSSCTSCSRRTSSARWRPWRRTVSWTTTIRRQAVRHTSSSPPSWRSGPCSPASTWSRWTRSAA